MVDAGGARSLVLTLLRLNSLLTPKNTRNLRYCALKNALNLSLRCPLASQMMALIEGS
jgi:hypothetical protein